MKSFSNNEQESVTVDTSALATSAKQDTQTTELQAIKTSVQLLDNAISGNEMQVDVITSALPSGASTLAEQQSQTTELGAIKTSVQLLDNAIAGNEMQVDVVTMPVVQVEDNGGSLTVDGTVAATQSGTWNTTAVVTASGNITVLNSNLTGTATAGSAVEISDLKGAGTLGFYVSGTWSATLQVQVSFDGTSWVTASSFRLHTGTDFQSSGVISNTTQYRFNCSGYKGVRITATAFTSGTAAVIMSATHGHMPITRENIDIATLSGATVSTGNGVSGSGVLRVAVASDNTIIPHYLGVSAASTNAATRVASTAAEASKVLKASAGRLYSLTVTTSKTSDQYFQIFNSTTVPADATAPIYVVKLPADSTINLDFSGLGGIYYSTGISVSNSTTMATKTIGSADCYISAEIA